MKTLGNLSPAPGSTRNIKRIGRGPGSGNGKTAGKGHKGQRARKGGGIAPGFEGGQTPLYRRLPKNGFSNKRNQVIYTVVNLKDLNDFTEGSTVSKESLKEAGLLRSLRHKVKILGDGSIDKKLTFKVDKVSASAKSAIEKVGGSIEEI